MGSEYAYEPSMAAAIIFIVLFSLTTIGHTLQMGIKRTWFMIPFCIGGILEIMGYVARTISASENPGPYSSTPYIVQTITLLVSPALLAASIYMELGRIVLMLKADEQLFIRRTWLTKIFVCGDIFSFLVQAGGAGLFAAADADSIQTGKDIVVAGLFIQIIFFGLFVIAAAVFHFRVTRHSTQLIAAMPWRRHMYALYAVSILIFVRSIVRVVEFIQGPDGEIITNEVFLYVFDATVMFIAMAIMNWIHPSQVAKAIQEQDEAGKERYLEEGVQPVRGDGHTQGRNF